jgi:hypothetical protein
LQRSHRVERGCLPAVTWGGEKGTTPSLLTRFLRAVTANTEPSHRRHGFPAQNEGLERRNALGTRNRNLSELRGENPLASPTRLRRRRRRRWNLHARGSDEHSARWMCRLRRAGSATADVGGHPAGRSANVRRPAQAGAVDGILVTALGVAARQRPTTVMVQQIGDAEVRRGVGTVC